MYVAVTMWGVQECLCSGQFTFCECWSRMPGTFRCVAMGSAVLFILRSRLLLYSARSGEKRVQVVLSGFSVRLLCFVQARTSCR